jgi:hypothetical protein
MCLLDSSRFVGNPVATFFASRRRIVSGYAVIQDLTETSRASDCATTGFLEGHRFTPEVAR